MWCYIPWGIPEQNKNIGGKTRNARKAWNAVNGNVPVLISYLGRKYPSDVRRQHQGKLGDRYVTCGDR